MTGTVEEEKKKSQLRALLKCAQNTQSWEEAARLPEHCTDSSWTSQALWSCAAHNQNSSPGRSGHQSRFGWFLLPQGSSALSGHTRNRDNILVLPKRGLTSKTAPERFAWPCPRLKTEAPACLPHIAAAASLLWDLFSNTQSWKVSTNSGEVIKKPLRLEN